MRAQTRLRLAVSAAVVTLLAVLAAAVTALTAAATASAPTANAGYTTRGAWTFKTVPNLHPPKLHTDAKTVGKSLWAGNFFLANFANITLGKPFAGQGGPLIVDRNLKPVWFRPAPKGDYTNNLVEQAFEGKPALSWWQGVITNTGATQLGTDVVVNQRYRTVATLTGAPGWVITQHEMIITGHDAWVTANSVPERVDGHTIVDSAAQEYNLRNGKLLRSWDASKHIQLTTSKQPAPPQGPWDAYHINSIQLLPGGKAGHMLVSMRNTWAGYMVDIATGKILWTISGTGKGGNYTLPANGHFEWQHDIELHPGNLLSMFDDACCAIAGPGKFAPPYGPSRGLLLKLNGNHTASFVHEYVHPPVRGNPVETAFQGNMQLLPNHNVVVGWGSAPYFSEYSSAGKLLFDTRFPTPDVTYRAYVFGNWVGLPPVTMMREVAKRSNGKTTVYVSWNGATRVVAWRLLGGSGAKHLRVLATATKRSFETAIAVKSATKQYKVQALDGSGRVIGGSGLFSAS